MGFLQTSFARARRVFKGVSSLMRGGWRTEQQFFAAEEREEKLLQEVEKDLQAIHDAQSRDTAKIVTALQTLEKSVHALELSEEDIGKRIASLVRSNADLLRLRFDIALQIMREFELLIRKIEEKSQTWSLQTMQEHEEYHAMAELLKEEFTKVDAQLSTLRENIYDSLETLQRHYRLLETSFSADMVSTSSSVAATLGLRTAKQDSGNLQDLRTFQATLQSLTNKLERVVDKGVDKESTDVFLTTLSTYGDGLQQLLRVLREGAAWEFQLLEQDLRVIVQRQRDLARALANLRALEGREKDASFLPKYHAVERRIAVMQDTVRRHAQDAGLVIRGPTALVKEGGGVLMNLRNSFLTKVVATSLLAIAVMPRPAAPIPPRALDQMTQSIAAVGGLSIYGNVPIPMYTVHTISASDQRAIEILKKILTALSQLLNQEFKDPILFEHPENKPGERPAAKLKDPQVIHHQVQEAFRKLGPVLLQYLRVAPGLNVMWKLYANVTPHVSLDSGVDDTGRPLSQEWILTSRGEVAVQGTLLELNTHLERASLIETGPDGVKQPLVEGIVEQGNIERPPYDITFPQARSAAAMAHYGAAHADRFSAEDIERVLAQDRNAKVCFSITIAQDDQPLEVVYFLPPVMPLILPILPSIPRVAPSSERRLETLVGTGRRYAEYRGNRLSWTAVRYMNFRDLEWNKIRDGYRVWQKGLTPAAQKAFNAVCNLERWSLTRSTDPDKPQKAVDAALACYPDDDAKEREIERLERLLAAAHGMVDWRRHVEGIQDNSQSRINRNDGG